MKQFQGFLLSDLPAASPNWFKRLISNVRIWFHNHGIKIKHLSDDDIANIILRSASAARDERRSSVVKDNLTTENPATPEESKVKDEESEVKQSAFDNLKDRSSEIDFTFEKFYDDFAPQLDAIIAKARRAFEGNLGNDIENDWRSAAYEAMAKAYVEFMSLHIGR